MDQENREILNDFREAVNMTPKELENWLQTDQSKSVGYKENETTESVGHKSGQRIVQLLHTRQADYTENDFKHMQKVVGYVHRHLAQRPVLE